MTHGARDAATFLALLYAVSSLGAPAEFWSLLQSKDHETRLEAVRGFAIDQSTQSFDDAARVALITLDDEKDDVQLYGAYILQRLARTTEGLQTPSSPSDRDLVARLRKKVIQRIATGSEEVAAQLAIAHTLSSSDSVEFERLFLKRLDSAGSLTAKREFIDAIAWNGLLTPEASARLLELASGNPSIVAHESAIVLADLQPPSEQLIVVLLRLASTDDFFCDPRLIAPLSKSPKEAREHLTEIKALYSRLELELKVDPFKRKTKIYAPEHWLNTLQNVIAALER